MPAQPACFHRLDEILSALCSMTSTHLDRAAVEKLFRVRRRRARQIMAGFEGLRVGNAAAVSRPDVRYREKILLVCIYSRPDNPVQSRGSWGSIRFLRSHSRAASRRCSGL